MAGPIVIDTTSTLETVLAFAGPLVGVAIGAWGSWRVAQARDKSAEQRAERDEILRAFANYMAAAELVAVELGSFPEESRSERFIDRFLPEQRRLGSYLRRLLERAAFGDRHDALRRDYQRARAELVLVAPIEVIGLVLRVDDFFIEWQNVRGPEMVRRWVDLSREIRLVGQITVDAQQGRPYRAGEPPFGGPEQPMRTRRFFNWTRARVSGSSDAAA